MSSVLFKCPTLTATRTQSNQQRCSRRRLIVIAVDTLHSIAWRFGRVWPSGTTILRASRHETTAGPLACSGKPLPGAVQWLFRNEAEASGSTVTIVTMVAELDEIAGKALTSGKQQ